MSARAFGVVAKLLLLVGALFGLARVFEAYVAPEHLVDWLMIESLCT